MRHPLSMLRRGLIGSGVALALMAGARPAPAHTAPNASDASLLSASLPMAVSVAAPAAYFSVAGAVFTVVAIETSAVGTVWILARASDGVRASLSVAGRGSVAVGASLSAVAVSTGWVLVEAGATLSAAVCFVPNAVGASLLYNEQLTR